PGNRRSGGGFLRAGPRNRRLRPARRLVRPGEPGPHDLRLVSVLSPPPGSAAAPRDGVPAPHDPTHVVREEDQPALPAGDDREFRVLVDPRIGCPTMTQFVGYIDRSQAPPHVHAYE